MKTTATGRERLTVAAVTGGVAGVALAFVAPWPFALLAAWDVGAVALVTWVWLGVGHLTAERTREVATREDPSRVASSLVLLVASVASLLGAGVAVLEAGKVGHAEHTALMVVSAATVFLSWGVVQTLFALRYAHEYYSSPEGGLEFGGGHDDPDYQDFAYFAFTIGMTFQTSDVVVSARRIRRSVLRHALLAYLFGAVILAVTVNVIAGLIR